MAHVVVRVKRSQSFGSRLGARQRDTLGDTIERKRGAHGPPEYHI